MSLKIKNNLTADTLFDKILQETRNTLLAYLTPHEISMIEISLTPDGRIVFSGSQDVLDKISQHNKEKISTINNDADDV